MALFRRKKQVTTEIPELQDYYATQKKDNTAVAWLLAISSLLITVLIFVGLFMGGRWLYRTLTDKDQPNTTTTQTEDASTGSPNTSTETSPENPNNTSTAPNDSTSTPSPTPPTSTPQGVSPNQSAQSNQSATAATTALPNSGPGSIAVIFTVTTVAGTVLYRRKLLKNN